jgi:hypothetical protein
MIGDAMMRIIFAGITFFGVTVLVLAALLTPGVRLISGRPSVIISGIMFATIVAQSRRRGQDDVAVVGIRQLVGNSGGRPIGPAGSSAYNKTAVRDDLTYCIAF